MKRNDERKEKTMTIENRIESLQVGQEIVVLGVFVSRETLGGYHVSGFCGLLHLWDAVAMVKEMTA